MKKIINFLKESYQELSKVVWPTRRQAIEMMIAVLIIVIIVSLYLGGLDYVLTKALTYLLAK